MKTPKKIRSDIRTLAQHLEQVRLALLKRSDITIAQIGKECKRTADVLGEVLRSHKIPDEYKVAVVGRFKTGKSSFVNELLGARLANEETNPETAAITTFRHGTKVKATVRFVMQEEWVKLQQLYSEDATHVNAHRVKIWNTFGKPKRAKEGEPEEVFDLPALEKQFVRVGGLSIEIELAGDGTKKAEGEFRRKLKEFTSGSKPHHCLVEGIEITSPAAILEEGVLLIDTPGLDDTERYRVSLTEKTVDDADAVLFLTKSGAAYSQSEKDFLLSLLRKGTVKQLIVVITQVDQTYNQHLRCADDNDDEPESLVSRIERERIRVSAEIATTLNGLSQDDSPAMRRYREQLGNIEIAFTSTVLHRDWKANKPVPYAIDPADPGGVMRLEGQLMRLLSSESRLALAAQSISVGARNSLLDLQSVLQTKLIAIREIKDKEVAKQKLRTFRDEFGKASERFEGAVKQQVTLLGDLLQIKRSQHDTVIENISLLAQQQLSHFETDDIGRHWRTRRSAYWGYMDDFQTRVANRIFPKVQQMLSEYTEAFSEFATRFELYLTSLSREAAEISESLELGAALPFDVTTKLKESLGRTLQGAQEEIAAEELRVTALLNDFVSDEVSERISERRAAVSAIWGAGTNNNQSSEVREFYREVKSLLGDALDAHLKKRGQQFGKLLVRAAERAPRVALDEVQVLFEQAADNIRAAAAALVAGQKEMATALVTSIEQDYQDVLRLAENLMAGCTVPADEFPKLGEVPVVETMPATNEALNSLVTSEAVQSEDAEDWTHRIRRDATSVVHRIRLRDGTSGWSFERLFEQRYLNGAVRFCLIDPYLAANHQIRNLKEFLLHIAETVRPKAIEIVTAFAPSEQAEHQERAIDDICKELFRNFGVALTVSRSSAIHDRSLVLDHGVLFKLGRGLDIYKPATGLAAHRPASRKVRETEIDVFALPSHHLVAARSE